MAGAIITHLGDIPLAIVCLKVRPLGMHELHVPCRLNPDARRLERMAPLTHRLAIQVAYDLC